MSTKKTHQRHLGGCGQWGPLKRLPPPKKGHHEVPLDQVLAETVRYTHNDITKWCIVSDRRDYLSCHLGGTNSPAFRDI